MKRLQRITAFLLCLIMMLPTQVMPVLAETLSAETSLEGFIETEGIEDIEEMSQEDTEERDNEILPLEELTEEEVTEEETERISETLPLEELTDEETEHISETLPLEELTEETERINETLPLEELPEEETNHISETLPLESLDGSGALISELLDFEDEYEEGVIYWNPGGTLPEELEADSNVSIATDSDAEKASPSIARRGSDSSSGFSAKAPVKSLKAALKRAEQLQEEGLDPSEIIIYAMNPMEISDGQLYMLNTAGVNIISWPERAYDSDVIFYINGGQLTIMNLFLESGDPEQDAELTELIYVKGGTLQIGENVSVNGCIVMDYCNESEGLELEDMIEEADETVNAYGQTDQTSAEQDDIMETEETASIEMAEAAKETQSLETIIDKEETAASTEPEESSQTIETESTEENTIQFLKDTKTTSTWREPLIELLEGFDGSGGSYLLDVRGDDSIDQVELVRTLYADEQSGEDYMELFQLVATEEEIWSLSASSEIEAQIRDTNLEKPSFTSALSDSDDEREDIEEIDSEEIDLLEVLSRKTLIATRNSTGNVIYWNPGGLFYIGNQDYPAGKDEGNDGLRPGSSFKTFKLAVERAGAGGTIICMQTLTLGTDIADECLAPRGDGTYHINPGFGVGNPKERITLRPWELKPQAAILVPEGEQLVLENIILGGYLTETAENDSAVILIREGDVEIGSNVKSVIGYIQMETFSEISQHPITVQNKAADDEDQITIFFTGISKNISYRYSNVIVPKDGGALTTIEEKEAFGDSLLNRFKLHKLNSSDLVEGGSKFDWVLRKDTDEDGQPAEPEKLELYTMYYYDVIYLNGETGKDTFYGTDCEYPVKTWERAKEIWSKAIEEGVAAREAGKDKLTPKELDERFPLPTIIYICDTVKISEGSAESPVVWELEEKKDYNNETIETEIVSHVDIPNMEGTEVPVHDLPKSLICVMDGGNLTIKDLVIRNISDIEGSNTIMVESGGVLTFTGSTILTGERKQGGTDTGYTTHGDHVVIAASGSFTMDKDWKGSIEKGQRGIVASGAGTVVTMDNGSIRDNNSFDQEKFDNKKTDHLVGSGVVLTGGASFTMNGGTIENNTVYQYGAGVYLTGEYTAFTMNKGHISGNKMGPKAAYKDATITLMGQGIGIYSGQGSKLFIQGTEESNGDKSVKITGNQGYYTQGVGIFSNGSEISIENASILKNFTKSINTQFPSNGIGICVISDIVFTMTNSEVIGNYGSQEQYGEALGAGIYLQSSKDNHIIDCDISENKVGYHRNSSLATVSSGGGIYLSGNLTIKGSSISTNQAAYGGGIALYASSTSTNTLNIIDTKIFSNIGQGFGASTSSGYGGGIYQSNGTLNLSGETVIGGESAREENYAYSYGGGIYRSNGTLNITGKADAPIIIGYNRTTSSSGYGGGIHISGTGTANLTFLHIKNNAGTYGAGIYASSATVKLTDSKITNNKATSGGGIYSYSAKLTLMDSEVTSNVASSNGGGLLLSGGYTYSLRSIIENNSSGTYGGGIYTTGTGYYRDTVIQNNSSKNGGGMSVHLASSTKYHQYLTNTVLKGNIATENGGALYVTGYSNTSLSDVYIAETESSKSEISSNKAKNGGGIYTAAYGQVYMDIAGPIQNTATDQGSNLYLTHTGSWIINGEFKQPDPAVGLSTYNIFVDIKSGTDSHSLYLDPQNVKVEAKNDSANEDVIYLNTASSFLTYLQEPVPGEEKKFPIDVNVNNFKVGSIVIRPVERKEVKFHLVKADASGTEEHSFTYGPFINASINLSYSEGGKLPRRMDLAGFSQDPSADEPIVNVVLVGEGVYLSGTGSDGNEGRSPSDAVQTFKKAKELLEKRIQDAEKEPDDLDGYSPFIYICGSVKVESSQTWELEYDQAAFASDRDLVTGAVNYKYKISEEAVNYPVEDAQVRRFASFVNEPMIQVSVGGELTTGKIIINGMMEAVVANAQDSNSPIIQIDKEASAILYGFSRITNNYYGGVNVNGSLTLTGEENDENKQLLNHGGYYVQLGEMAELNMNGYARIIAEGKVKRQGNQNLIGVLSNASGTKATMEGHAQIIYIDDKGTYKNGEEALLSAGIYLLGSGSEVTMTDNSSMENLSKTGSIQHPSFPTTEGVSGIAVGEGGTITMDKEAQMLDFINGYGMWVGKDATATMATNAKIKNKGITLRNAYGVYLLSSKLFMKDSAEINSRIYGINSSGANVRIVMQDSSLISNCSNYGIYSPGASTQIEMQGSSAIRDSGSYGINISNSGKIHMNMNEGAGEEDSAQITGSNGIYVDTYNEVDISLGKKSLIKGENKTYGIRFYNNSSGAGCKLLMQNNSRISGFSNSGIYLHRYSSPINITMIDSAAIEDNGKGIYEHDSSNNYGVRYFQLDMDRDSRISGNSSYGISLSGRTSFTEGGTQYIKLNLSGNAIIGGSSKYSKSDPKSGNGHAGIYTNAPIQLNMSGDSKIAYNGYEGTGANANANAVYITRYISSAGSYYRNGTAKISLSDKASICDNKRGIYTTEGIVSNNILYKNPTEISLKGNSSIHRNEDAVYMKGSDQKITLEDFSNLGAATEVKVGDLSLSLDTFGSLVLDGNSTINGVIYLRTETLPITMTQPVPPESEPGRYSLWLAEGFVGDVVVQPEDPTGTITGKLYDVSDQLKYFNKVGGDGLASDRELQEQKPYIMLQGTRHVYLSGKGNNNNTGYTPNTPVRSFWKAKQILENGNFTTGSNIIICDAVTALKDDTDWSFDSDGKVLNNPNGVSWTPKLLRYESNTGQLIKLENGNDYASKVNFKNITIDGGSKDEIILKTYKNYELLSVGAGTTAVLGEGAVLQNNETKTSAISGKENNSTLGVMVIGGTLEINGGIIQNMINHCGYSVNQQFLALAITCNGTLENPGKIIMTSGKIINNKLDASDLHNIDNFLGTVYLGNQYAEMVLSGGIIENNQVLAHNNSQNTGTLLLNNGSATIEGGTIQNNQTSYKGSAIYYYGDGTAKDSLVLSGGQISDNTPSVSGTLPEGVYSPIYIGGRGFKLKGGAANIKDYIYLTSTDNIITLSDRIYQPGRRYDIFINQGTGDKQFKKGSVVIQPDADYVTDVSAFHQYFEVHSNPYVLDMGRVDIPAGTVAGVRENQCLILMRAIYLNSEGGDDSKDGMTPANAVATFKRAEELGTESSKNQDKGHYIIYISGLAYNTEAATWLLPETSYMCRYTGFQIYASDGSDLKEAFKAYHGVLIKPKANLELKDIYVYGRRRIDIPTVHNGERLIEVSAGKTVKVMEGTVFLRNYNNGAYTDDTGQPAHLSSEGGAFYVEAGGVLNIQGGVIQDTEAAKGSAIFLEDGGRLLLTGTPVIMGRVYLDGEGASHGAYVEPDGNYKPSSALNLSVANDYSGRKVVHYRDNTEPDAEQMNYYAFEDSIKALYEVVKNEANPYIMEFYMKKVIYLDGVNGNDDFNGETPDQAFKTLKKVYETIVSTKADGVLVYIVNTIDITNEIKLNNTEIKDADQNYFEGSYQEENEEIITIKGQVYFKRYSKPSGYTGTGFSKGTLKETLFRIKEGGHLTLNGIYVDGHSVETVGNNPKVAAKGVEAEAPLITVEPGGELTCSIDTSNINATTTHTLFTNNLNITKKEKVIGTMGNSDAPDAQVIKEGSSAGIEILASDDWNTFGTVFLNGTRFRNLSLGKDVIGGSDIYSNGQLSFRNRTYFTGTVFLEGLGTEFDAKETSRYLTVAEIGWYAETRFHLVMRDPYRGRDVVHYPSDKTPDLTNDIVNFLLEDRIKDYFCLSNKVDAVYILELQVPVAVYVDGADGKDDLDNPFAGSNPGNPVQNLWRAYDLLSTRGGGTVYVVNTIQIKDDIDATGSYFESDKEERIMLPSASKVKITRYIQPDFARNAVTDEEKADVAARGYNVVDFTGVLINVQANGALQFSHGVYIDGHHEIKESDAEKFYREEETVTGLSYSDSPLITVAEGGTLKLLQETYLLDNHNKYEEADKVGMVGSVLYNSGTTIVDGALFTNNISKNGADIYQDGTFTIESATENLKGHSFYLTTRGDVDHVIQLNAKMRQEPKLVYDIEMDNPIKGRDVIKFMDPSAYDGNADAEHDHFKLGDKVPKHLFLVQSPLDAEVLELQNWEVLNVEIPSNIYLVIRRRGEMENTTNLKSVRLDASEGELFSSPDYTITNKGIYDVRISVEAFENANADAGITQDPMKLVQNANDIIENNELYLAVQGLDQAGGNGFTFGETSLEPYTKPEESRPEAMEFGVLNPEAKGSFTFLGTVARGFVDKYKDNDFPLKGNSKKEVQEYMDGTSDSRLVNARAKFDMKFRLEMVPPRRDVTVGGGNQ